MSVIGNNNWCVGIGIIDESHPSRRMIRDSFMISNLKMYAFCLL